MSYNLHGVASYPDVAPELHCTHSCSYAAQLDDEDLPAFTFHECLGYETCTNADGTASGDSRCDCLGGEHTRVDGDFVSEPYRCNDGYVNGTSLCFDCDTDDDYARVIGRCAECPGLSDAGCARAPPASAQFHLCGQ